MEETLYPSAQKIQQAEENLIRLFERWSGESPEQILPLPLSGSNRRYFRLQSRRASAIGAFNPDSKENLAYTSFSVHFLSKGLPVPKLHITDLAQNIYLIQDLGDLTLFEFLKTCKQNGNFPIEHYQKALDFLVKFQVRGAEEFDFSLCYPRAKFDAHSVILDLQYFKYYFLKFSEIPFDETLLEKDFETFAHFLTEEDSPFFMYRDFQARNIMLFDEQLYFIDFQGGQQGALQYDLASLLFQAKAEISPEIRADLLEYYLSALSKVYPYKLEKFVSKYYGYVLIRMLQTLGAYGFRGYYQRKPHFLESIPFAIKNLDWFLSNINLPLSLPELTSAIKKICHHQAHAACTAMEAENDGLHVSVFSFSYKNGFADDRSGNGGGFVFDCRALPNPGRLPEYKHLTGKDPAVQAYLRQMPEVETFLQRVFAMIDSSVQNYLKRSFSDLMVSFGCTGGQHRSVYCAERLAQHLRKTHHIHVSLVHYEQERKGWVN
ncbi:conserved hypothetical protein [Chloroherpeton thalassium ATCC 35110]|uniref:Uncharacterized protein n=1 Tax=Chloroherpeton thalassium (strain ATCC 35110 / GB-78) TaxID=517418 RepID=B3QWY4_CHLT3|nr:RNase adapter RapZ [Chloroherpeton thalassium]ACF13348.1 conserved hypothetical protein [Chloroherpeton thalassium ATCC 35110]